MASEFFTNGSTKSAVDTRAFLDSGVPDGIAALMDLGCLVSIGTTRDGGAVSITVTHDGAYRREYFRDPSEAADWLGTATQLLRADGLVSRGDVADASPAPLRRPRSKR